MAVLPRKFKTGAQVRGKLALPDESASKALTISSTGEVTSSVTTDTELSYVSGVTGSIQDQLDMAASESAQASIAAAAAQTSIDNHIADTVDAHDASAISVAPTGNLASTDVQSALVELQGDINSLVTLSGVAAGSTDLGTFTGVIIPDASTVKSALQSIETFIGNLPDPMEYKGLWNASTNSPTLTDGTGNNGDVYQVSVAGSQFSPSISFDVGDKAVYNGATGKYEKWDMTDAVISVNGQSGIVVLDSDDISEGSSNLYFTDERAQDAVGTILADSNTIDFTYNDATPSIVADVKTQLSITSDSSGIKLVNDSATPGNTKYYGTDGSGTKGFFSIPAVGSAGDIQETSFSMANNQASPANITGFAFAAGTVRSFKALVSVAISATTPLYEEFEISGIQRAADFAISVESTGNDSGVSFDISSSGQVTYTSANASGFTAGVIKFRAQTTSV